MTTRFQRKLLCLGILTTILLPLFAHVETPLSDLNQAPAAGGEIAYYLAEHGDFDIGFEEGQLGLHVHVRAGGSSAAKPCRQTRPSTRTE